MVRKLLLAGIVLALAIQVIPFGRDHDNPPVETEPAWDSSRTEALIRGACYDCHSNETAWPWYSNIAPISWLVQRDVDEGRDELNFSSADDEGESDDIVETILDGTMPPWPYELMHADARLSDSDIDKLISGIEKTFGSSDNEGEGSEDD